MAIAPFLAMTAAEIRNVSVFPEKLAWMACHFSPYELGLSNLPVRLPHGSLLILDDITPPHGHDPELITQQITKITEQFQCSGILLDFQRTEYDETRQISKYLAQALPCKTIISACFAEEMDCAVFMPSQPPSVSLSDYLKPWTGRDIWLETGLDAELLTLTKDGCRTDLLPYPGLRETGFSHKGLHCHYNIRTNETSARFTLWRTMDDWSALLNEAENCGVTAAVGLYQELRNGFFTLYRKNRPAFSARRF